MVVSSTTEPLVGSKLLLFRVLFNLNVKEDYVSNLLHVKRKTGGFDVSVCLWNLGFLKTCLPPATSYKHNSWVQRSEGL